ncbi:MAG: hypothetical protein ACJ72V_06600, partial [Nitrososphaeraceae archaeon]
MPIIDLGQKRYCDIQNLSLDTNGKYLIVNDKYQKDRAENNNGGNNNTHSLISSYHYCSNLDLESNNNTTTSSNTPEEDLPFVSII